MGYLIDTNILSDYIKGALPQKTRNVLRKQSIIRISFITKIELLCWKEHEDVIKNFISICSVENITEEIINKCISIRRSYAIKLPDAIIAATAISENLTLITGNSKDFKAVRGLKILKP
jgi:toxin FitB